MDCQLKRSLLERVLSDKRLCLEGFLLTYYRQFPLPSFALGRYNSVENITGNSQKDALIAGRVFFDQGRAILRFFLREIIIHLILFFIRISILVLYWENMGLRFS